MAAPDAYLTGDYREDDAPPTRLREGHVVHFKHPTRTVQEVRQHLVVSGGQSLCPSGKVDIRPVLHSLGFPLPDNLIAAIVD